MSQYFTADQGVIWVQPHGPNTAPEILLCADIDDLSQPQGDVTQRYCPNPDQAGTWDVVITSQAPEDRITTTLTTYVSKVASALYNVQKRCPFPIYVHQSCGGTKKAFSDYDAGNLIRDAFFTSKGKTNLAMRETADASEATFEVSATPPLSEYWKFEVTRLPTDETEALRDIAACGRSRCATSCSSQQQPCDVLYATAEAATDATANVLVSTDAGASWAATAADPFATINEDLSSVICFPIDRNTTCVVVARGTTDVASPAEIARTVDGGINWTPVNVGSTNGEYFVPSSGALFSFDGRHTWGVTDLGNIFFSETNGTTWVEQTSTNTTQLNYIHFANYQEGLTVGNTNVILETTDGGEHWRVVSGPGTKAADNILSCGMLDRYRWWIGYDDGELWYTFDAGASWAQRILDSPATAVSVDAIRDMHWLDAHHGSLAVNWTGAASAIRSSVYRTVNGGYDWEIYDIPDTFDAGDGLYSVLMCSENEVFTVGGPETTAGIYTLAP